MLGVMALWTPKAHAQTDFRPLSAGRIVRAFDFEERDYNPLPIPFGWVRAQNDPRVPRNRPGFPIWNGGQLDYHSPAYSGIGSVRLPTEGGSTSLILRHGELGVFPDADYMITARVRTDGLAHARARILARLLDQQGNIIRETQVGSELVHTDGHWDRVAVMLEGLSADAAYMQIELQLLQPEQQPRTAALGKYAVWQQDFSGAVFFDDVMVAQLPRLELTTDHPGNIVLSEEIPAIKILIRDLTGEKISASASVFDVHGVRVDHAVISNGSRRVRTDWVPNLTKFGWYRAFIEVHTNNELVGIRTLDFFWAPPNQDGDVSTMFGIQVDATRDSIAQAIKPLADGASVGFVAVNVWDAQTTEEDFQTEGKVLTTLDTLIRADLEVSIGFREVPIGLADALAADTTAVLDVFASSMDRWNAWGGQLLDRYGQSTAHWSFGAAATEEPASKLDSQLAIIHDQFSRFVPGPIISVPWGMDRPIDPVVTARARGVQIQDIGATHSGSMPLIIQDWASTAPLQSNGIDDPATLTMVLRPVGQAGFVTDSWSAAGALGRKAISFWWASQTSGYGEDHFQLLLADAWTITPGKRAQVMPAPELHIWRTLASRLAGRRAIEELDLLDGTRILLLGPKPGQPETQGAMIVWLDDPQIGHTQLTLPLAQTDLTRIDLFENKTTIPLQVIGGLKLPVHEIAIGRTPVFIEGVNIPLTRFLSNIRLTPNTIESRSGIHDHELIISNPWPYPISGRVYIVEPGGYTSESGTINRSWEIAPRVVPFTLGAGDVLRTPIELAFSSGELAGTKPLVFDVELAADRQYPLMRVPRQIQLGFDGLEITATAKSVDNGITEITVSVTNRMKTAQNLEVIAVPVREPRARASISGIEPRSTVSRRFVFKKTKPGDTVLIGVTIRDQDIRINSTVEVP